MKIYFKLLIIFLILLFPYRAFTQDNSMNSFTQENSIKKSLEDFLRP